MNIASFLTKAARSFADRPAVSRGTTPGLTYGALAARVSRLAATLTKRFGLQPGDRLALTMTNCPEYIEVLLRHAGVLEVSVVGRPHRDWGEEVVAFVVPRPDHSVTKEALDRLCLDAIARFKRPRQYVFVAELPKNNYGKILKTALRQQMVEAQEDRS